MAVGTSNGSGLFSMERPVKPHLLNADGLAGEVRDLRSDVGRVLTPVAAFTVDEFTNAAAADANAIKTSVASVAAPTVYEGAALNGVLGSGLMNPARNVTISTAGVTPADAPATALIEGKDLDGRSLSETIVVSQVAGTAVGVKAFARVTKITLPAADGVDALLEFGFGDKIGLSKSIKTRAGLTTLLQEIEAGVVVTTGTIADSVVGAPHGTYLAAMVPDGAKDYAVYYEYDPTA